MCRNFVNKSHKSLIYVLPYGACDEDGAYAFCATEKKERNDLFECSAKVQKHKLLLHT